MVAPRLFRVLRGAEARTPSALVAIGKDAAFDRADLSRRVAALAAALARTGRGRWLLYSESSYAAAVSLLALAHSGCSAILAPNPQSETLRQLANGAQGALLDPHIRFDAAARLDPLAQPSGAAPRATRIDQQAPFVELHSSGSTGRRATTRKSLRQLEEEIRILEALFGPTLAEAAPVFATVSHQHIYGLLFRVLWPLASGRPFLAESLLHAQELLPRMAQEPACALVSTPAHLKRAVANAGLRSLRGRCRAVFSSGGPLDAEVAKRVAEQLGAAPLEILGSTETGGVALRQRSIHGEAWSPFPGICVEREAGDGRLVVTSALASEGQDVGNGRRRYTMGDRIELLADGSFYLLGRADRTVKIGDKRLSLPDMEHVLACHAFVEQAAIVVLASASEPRAHAVIVPTPTGSAALATQGRRQLGAALSEHLAGHFDRVLLPRRWRVVDDLPRDPQGKVSVDGLRALFEDRTRELRALHETRDAHCLERRLEIPDGLAYFDGHFPGRPIVAGVVLLHWAMLAAAELLDGAPCVTSIEALKFPSSLGPGDRFTLRVEINAAHSRVDFRAGDGERVYASGRCRLGPRSAVAP
jgi:acyl-coenzyme A synthetase/AMP-(fatty) acid ligase